MEFQEKIEQLKSIINQQIAPLIDRDYVLYELPYYNNIGDLLIWEGELAFLKQFPYRMKDACSLQTYDTSRRKKIDNNTIILLQGGGNFGDLWRKVQEFRLNIIQKHPNNKIIIFPQTVFYTNTDLMKKDAQIMSLHKDLTICARDKVSYEFLKKHFTNKILLVPDMAFCIPTEQLKKWIKPVCNKTLFLKRSDYEFKKSNYIIPNQYPLCISDWPTMEHIDMVQQGMRYMSILRKLGKPSFQDWYGAHLYRRKLIKKGVKFISQYKEIYTTRLHAAILSILLEKSFHFLDNSYGKNKTFFDTWLSDIDEGYFEKN